MCCLVATLMLVGPRAGILIWWLADQSRWERAFDNFAWAFFGFLFLPWTTLMFVLVAPGGTITGFDWVWLGLSLIGDLASYGGGRYGQRSYVATRSTI